MKCKLFIKKPKNHIYSKKFKAADIEKSQPCSIIEQIKAELKKPMTIYIGKSIAKFHITREGTLDEGFLVIISDHASPRLIERYKELLQEGVKFFYRDEQFYESEGLTLEDILKFYISRYEIPIAGFYNLVDCQQIKIDHEEVV